jgi:hypothetical protein
VTAEAFKLLQRLPRGPLDPDDQTWVRVHDVVGDLYDAVVKASSVGQQETARARFESGIRAAQDELGKALDRLDQELVNEISGRPGRRHPLTGPPTGRY